MLSGLPDHGTLTINDENGRELMKIDAAALRQALGKDTPGALFSDIILRGTEDTSARQRCEALGTDPDASRRVFLIELRSPESGAAELLAELFDEDSGSVLLSLDGCRLALISEDLKTPPEDTANMLISTLNTELMTASRVGFGEAAAGITGLRRSFLQAEEALRICGIFYEERLIADHASLGTGGLLADVSEEACLRFLKEKGMEDVELSEEELGTVSRFLENDLKLSETARCLFLHRNTLVYHLEKIEKKTGLDIRRFDDAMTLKLMLMTKNRLRARTDLNNDKI